MSKVELINGVSVERAGGSSEEAAELLQAFLTFWEANNDLDDELLATVWSDAADCLFFNSNGHVWRGLADWSSIWAYYRTRIRTTVPAEVRDVQIHIAGDLAVVIDDDVHREFEWIGDEPLPDLFRSSQIRTTMVFRRFANTWKAVHAHFSLHGHGERPGD